MTAAVEGAAAGRATPPPRARTGQRTSPERESEVRHLHAAGWTRNAIAREVGISHTTVGRIVRDAGGTFDRSATAAATQARAIDQRAERTHRAGSLLLDLEWLQRRMRTQDEARDLADVSKALLNVTSAHARLAALGHDDGAGAAMEGLGRLLALLTAASADEPYVDPNTGLPELEGATDD